MEFGALRFLNLVKSGAHRVLLVIAAIILQLVFSQ